MIKKTVYCAIFMAAFVPWVHAQAIGIFEGQVSIGTDAGSGSATLANEVYDVIGSGHDLWGTADGAYFVYKAVTGPFIITGEINWELSGPRDGDEWKKAGFMARNTTVEAADDPSANHVAGVMIRSQGSNLQQRAEYNGESADIEVQEKRSDETNVFQLMRVGNTFTMLRGLTDGSFRVIGSTDVEMEDTILVGLVVTSHDTSVAEKAFFKNVTLQALETQLTATRTLPAYSVKGGAALTGISLGLAVEAGKTADAVVTEKVPDGFAVSNLTPSSGTATISGATITWTLPGATGSGATLKYDLTPASDLAGVYSFSGSAKTGDSSYSSGGDWQVTVVPPASNGYGVFTAHEDVFDTETVAGDAGYDPQTGTYVVIGTGADIWGQADNFHYLYREVSGDATLKATCHLFEGEGDTEWVKIGPMIRDEIDPGSSNAFSMIRTWGRDFGQQWRDFAFGDSVNGGDENFVPGGEGAGLQSGTVEISRDGSSIQFAYYDSASGQRVEKLVQDTVELTDPILIGFAVTSHREGSFSTGVFTDVSLTVNGQPVSVLEWALY